MKVLHINTSDHQGGAAVAALRLIRALRRQGVDATLLCRDRSPVTANDEAVTSLPPSLCSRAKFVGERAEIFLRNGLSRHNLFAIDQGRFGHHLTTLNAFTEADIIHLHWINQAMLSIEGIARILQSGKPVVWTMHDMWPFTGICHQAGDCTRWQSHCGSCPLLRRPAGNDLSAQTFRRKQKALAQGHIHLVGCSKWLTALAASSPLTAGAGLTAIPNAIDTDFYAPTDRQTALREELNLPTEKRLLLFAAFKATDVNKGTDYLREALSLFAQRHPEWAAQTAIVVAGKESETLCDSLCLEAYPMGYVEDDNLMRNIYRSVDLLLMPTLMDNLPNTIVEAMACGVPCVGFDIGGVGQMVDTGVNGYLARYKDAADFATGIERTLFSPSYAALRRNARSKATGNYSEKVVAEKYAELYRSLLTPQASPQP